MFEKTCRCGKSKRRFKMDIGPFYIDECCIEAGYDEMGNLKGEAKAPAKKEEPKTEAPQAPAAPTELSDKEKKKLEKERKKQEKLAKQQS